MKRFFLVAILFSVSNFAMANEWTVAASNNQSESKSPLTLNTTLNNQTASIITTDSSGVPDNAKQLAPKSAVMFELDIPNGYINVLYTDVDKSIGCEFTFFKMEVRLPPPTGLQYIILLTNNPITKDSICTTTQTGGVNILNVGSK